jgi:hypothetical protein
MLCGPKGQSHFFCFLDNRAKKCSKKMVAAATKANRRERPSGTGFGLSAIRVPGFIDFATHCFAAR